MQQVVLEVDVAGQLVVVFAEEERVVQREIDVAVPGYRGVQCLPGDERRLRDYAVAGFEKQPLVVDARARVADFGWVQPQPGIAVPFLHEYARGRERAVAAEGDETHRRLGFRHGQGPDEATGPLDAFLEVGLVDPQALLCLRRVLDVRADVLAHFLVVHRHAEAAPELAGEDVALQGFAVRRDQPGIQWVGQQLVGAGEGGHDRLRDPVQAHPRAVPERAEGLHRAQVRGAEQHHPPHILRTPVADGELVVVEHVLGGVTAVVAGDQAAHAVGDHVDLHPRVAVVPANLREERVQLSYGAHVVLAPVVGEYVIVLLAGGRRLARVGAAVAAVALQHAQDFGVEVSSGRPVGEPRDHQFVRQRLERLRVDLEGEFGVVGEHDLPDRPGPHLAAGLGMGEPGAEGAGDEDHRRLDVRIGLHGIEPLQVRRRSGAGGERECRQQ